MKEFKQISVIGLGYIGLPTAITFANAGLNVVGVDINPNIVEKINQGKVHIKEPALEAHLSQCIKQKQFIAKTNVEEAEVFIIAVPTPIDPQNHKSDLTYIKAVSKAIAPVLKLGDLIILESTVPVGSTEKMAEWLAKARPDLTFPQQKGCDSDIRIAYCPERVLPGNILYELIHNDRIIGGMSTRCAEQAVILYKYMVKGECFVTNTRTAEMCKLTENAFRDVNIAFANEISMICDELGINVWELISLANHHPRVNILQAGCGVGGHCIAVDPWFIVERSPHLAKLIETARKVNDSKPNWVINKVNEAVIQRLQREPMQSIHNIKIACLGLTFKANVDDLRESPASKITEELSVNYPNQVIVVEPHIDHLPTQLDKKVEWVSLENAIKQADIIVILVEHDDFKQIEWREIKNKIVVDTKGLSY